MFVLTQESRQLRSISLYNKFANVTRLTDGSTLSAAAMECLGCKLDRWWCLNISMHSRSQEPNDLDGTEACVAHSGKNSVNRIYANPHPQFSLIILPYPNVPKGSGTRWSGEAATASGRPKKKGILTPPGQLETPTAPAN